MFRFLEGKMDHSFTPLAAYRKFREKKYDERFVFAKQVRTDDAIQKVLRKHPRQK